MNKIIWFFIDFAIFLVFFLSFYYLYFKYKKVDYNSLKKTDYIRSFIVKYDLNVKKIGFKRIVKTIIINNSIILSFTGALVTSIKNYYVKIGVSFVVLFILIYVFYEISGRYLKSKEDDK
jgi:hypothetical protein